MRGITIPVVLLGLSITILPATANSYPDSSRFEPSSEEFQTCASQLLAAGVAQPQVAITCARTLHPTELSDCVATIEATTELNAEDILARCERVRRPAELATCVTDINTGRGDAIALDVLDYCRRSLLPIRFSNCVLGVGSEVNFESTAVALEACISASDRLLEEELLPDFIFREESSENR
ncbi:MAG: hypothetical protein HC881_15250 [Leptolyngbyaceae cyanobacterium SL_7_1]|nr:hypothetical protein [Leptolyngbyaceae cyanobacterium SL_7_1]